MKATRWVFVAAALAGAVALVVPAVGQGKAESASLSWSQSPGGAAITSYDFAAADGGSRVTTSFRLGNSSVTKSGQLAIKLTGSSAFSIGANECGGKSIGQHASCLVSVVYAPLGSPASNSARLAATGAHGAAASLSLSGSNLGPAGHLYWADYSGTINRIPRGGGRVSTLARGQHHPVSLAVDGTHVYWIDTGTAAHSYKDGTVNEVPLGGGRVATLATGQTNARSLAVDATHVYWIDSGTAKHSYQDGTVNEVPLGGGTVTTLATGQNFPSAVAADGTHVYWVDWNGGTVNDVPLGGGSVTRLATGESDPSLVAVDGTNIYWANAGDGTIREVPLGGGTVTTLATGQYGLTTVALDATHAYWADGDSSIRSIPLGGGAVTKLAEPRWESFLTVDDTHVYWVTIRGTVNKVEVVGGRSTNLAKGRPQPVAAAVGP